MMYTVLMNSDTDNPIAIQNWLNNQFAHYQLELVAVTGNLFIFKDR